MGRPQIVIAEGQRPPRGRRGRVRIECVGESKFQSSLVAIAGGKHPESQYIETNAIVRREPGNPFDANAIQVLVANRLVAYLSREDAARYAPAMDAQGLESLSCAAEIRGGWKQGRDEGHFGVVVWLPRPDKL